MEGDEEKLAEWTLSQISNKTNAKIGINECEDAMVMEINSKLAGVPFTITFDLKMMTAQDVSVRMCILDPSTLSSMYILPYGFVFYQWFTM